MEDPGGSGPVPISLGAPALDPSNNQVGPVCGARKAPDSGLVVPVVMGDKPLDGNKGSPIQVGQWVNWISRYSIILIKYQTLFT